MRYGIQIDGGGGDSNASSPEIAAAGTNINITSLPNVPAEDVNMLLALASTDPDLQAAWDAYQNGDVDGMRSAILRSNFYKTFNSKARERAVAEKAQPDVWKQDLASYKLRAKKRLVEAGISWSPNIETQVESAYRYGMDDAMLDQMALQAFSGAVGGATSGEINQLKQYAGAYGVDFLYNDNYWTTQSRRIFAGETTAQDIQNEIQNLAAETYPAFADGFKTGKSFDMQTAYIKQTLGSVLEIDPNSIKANDPRLAKWAQYADPKSGQFVRPPQWLVAREARKDPSWAFTNNARNSVDGILNTALRDMGLM